LEATGLIDQDIKVLMGVFDPAQLKQGNISGKALNGQQQQVDLNNFDFYDNLCKSQAQVARAILDLIPKIYDTERVMRIIGDDGKPELVTVNERDAVNNLMKNDLTVGLYDVVMDTGPGYNSKRQEALETITPILSADPQLMSQIGDLWFRNMDFPGADVIADRLATLNPLAKVDEKSDVPPQVQMAMAQAQAQVQQMQQAMQEMQNDINYGKSVAQIKEEGATKRELLKATAKAHNTETMAEVKVNDQNTRAITSQNKVEIEAIMELLLHHMDTKRLEKEIQVRNAEQYAYANQANQDVANQ